MKKILSLLLSALLLASGAAVAVSAEGEEKTKWEENVDYIVHGTMDNPNYPASTSTGLPEVTTGQLLRGTVASSVHALDEVEDLPMSICDGDATTSFQVLENQWVGVMFDQAYELTEVRVVPNPNQTPEEMGGFRMQGSNDGLNWVTIISMGQNAHGNDYHIFTPQSVTDQRYIDAGYSKRTDESIWWENNCGSFQYYRVLYKHVGDIEFYGNPAPATELNADLAAIHEVSTYNYYHGLVHVRTGDEILNSVDGSLVGTVIAGGGVFNKALFERAFDGNNKTHYDAISEGPKCWVGMMFDEPHALTEVRILPKRGAQGNLAFGRFQGSLDGHSWEDIIVYTAEDVPAKQEWVNKTVSMEKGYTHFRYVATEQVQSSISELLLFGAPAEAADPVVVEPLIANHSKYTGPLHYSTGKNVVSGSEISGTPICGQYHQGWNDYGRSIDMAFDGDLSTYYGTISGLNGSQLWVGMKADAPTAIGTAKFYNPRGDHPFRIIYFQGSVDGANWVDLASIPFATAPVDSEGWVNVTVTDPTEYSYFRLMNDAAEHPFCSLEVNEIKLYAAGVTPETAAPETAAPETAAPETAAPETTAPETAAPETAAPETAAPETAAPETKAPETKAPETKAPETEAKETDAPKADDPAESNNNMGLIIGIAAAVVVIAVVAVVVIKKKK